MGPWDDSEYGRVVDGSGDYARVEGLQGRLIIVFPLGYIPHHPTRFTVPGKKSDVIVSDVIDLDDYDEQGQPGKIYRTAWWRQAQLIMSLRPWIGKRVLGRINKGISRNGMNAPWVINDAVAEPGATDRARAWGQAHPDFVLSAFEQPPAIPEPAPQPQFQYQQQGPPQGTPPGYGRPLSPPPPPQYQQQQYPGYGAPAAPPPNGGNYQPQPQYQQQGPPPPPPPPAPPQDPYQQQYQQPPQQQYQQQGPPSFPVSGAPQQDPNMLQLMRAQRERREAEQSQDPWADQPPF